MVEQEHRAFWGRRQAGEALIARAQQDREHHSVSIYFRWRAEKTHQSCVVGGGCSLSDSRTRGIIHRQGRIDGWDSADRQVKNDCEP